MSAFPVLLLGFVAGWSLVDLAALVERTCTPRR
jgi:hypothetical protein